MPKIVDHDQRRQQLSDAAWRVILREGVDGATTRLIARESGYSAGVLSHYFESKDDILLEALRNAHSVIKERLNALLEHKTGFEALRTFCYDTVPLQAEQIRETQLEISFWSRALVKESLRSVQLTESAYWHNILLGVIIAAQELGELVEGDPFIMADILAGLIDGLSVHALLIPDHYDEKRLIKLIDAQLALWSTATPKDQRGSV
ncbi:MAG: TetR family transcriptional regulator [Acidimicrobiaceae bacterium]|nr:TetR family transcriptional regulator [Acidimicrobiaceae bacterium]